MDEWKKDNGKTVNESIREYAEEYIGRPIHDVIRLVYFVFAFLIFCICFAFLVYWYCGRQSLLHPTDLTRGRLHHQM